jgi:hypothetical protein
MDKVPTEEPAAEAAKPAEGEVKPAVAETAPAETPEAKAAREALAAETPEQKTVREAAEAEAKRLAAEPPPNQAEIDLGESIAPAALLESIDKAPDAVKEWFNNPENPLKETLTTMARRAAIADPILREIPDVETAQRLVQTGAEYDAFDSSFDQIAKPEDALAWFRTMYNAQATKDAAGKIIAAHPAFQHIERSLVDSNLKYLTEQAKTGVWHPVLTNLFHDAMEAKLDGLKKAIAAGQDSEENQDALVALETLQRVSPRPSNKPPELTPEQKKAQEQINRERTELDTNKANERKVTIDTAFATVTKDVDNSMADQFVPVLDKAGLTDFAFEQAVLQIGTRLEAELDKHQYYKGRKEQLKAAINRDPSEANVKALKKHELTYRNMKIGRITKEVLREASAGPIKAQEDKQKKVAAQVEASKTEPRGTSAAAPTVQATGNTLAASQALWDADPKNAGIPMDMTWHFNRIMGKK